MKPFYTCIENQLRSDGSRGLLYDHYDDLNGAMAKHFTVCAAAATSGIPYHSSTILASDGRIVRQKIFDRRVEPEPEPEPTPEPETEG